MDISGKRFVVIGGAGLIGSHTVDLLTKEDVGEIVVYDNFVRGTMENLAGALRDPRVKIFEAGGDITQTDTLDAALKGADGVFHFAALWLLQCHEYPRSAFDVNVGGTFNVLDACVRNKVSRLVWSSSASVYGDAIEEPMDRGPPVQQQELLRRDQDLRRSDGPRLPSSLRARLRRTALHERVRPAAGLSRGLYRRDHEDARRDRSRRRPDRISATAARLSISSQWTIAARANLCAMRSDATDRFYNVGTGKRTSLKEIAEKLLNLTGSNQPITYAPRSQATLVRNRIGSPEARKGRDRLRSAGRTRRGPPPPRSSGGGRISNRSSSAA